MTASITFEDILNNLDLTAVEGAIFAPKREGGPPPKYSLDEVTNIKEMLILAGRRWLMRDLAQISFIELEKYVETPQLNIKAYMDVTGVLITDDKPFGEFKGERVVIDWKTREGELDQRWRNRLIDSWQWRIYASMIQAPIFIYRGISRRCALTESPCKEIPLVVPVTNDLEVEEFIRGKGAERISLINMGMTVWPRHQPEGCYTYGRECPFKQDCKEYSMPQYLPEANKVMSYSRFHDYCICPERARRLERLPEAEVSEEANVGTGFHLGIANLYQQAIKLCQ